MSYDIATKKSSLIKEYNVVNRLFCNMVTYGFAGYGTILCVMT